MFTRSLLESLLTPLPLLGLLLVAGLVFYLGGKKKAARGLLSGAVVWFLLISTPFLPKCFMKGLENRYPPIGADMRRVDSVSVEDSVVHILVLGAGYDTDVRLPYSGQLNAAGLARLTEGIRLHRLMPASTLIFSGYAGTQPFPQAKISALAAVELGVDGAAIDTLCKPWNTKDEAAEYLKRFGNGSRLYLVTDAAHMPRAMRHFRRAGLNPIPAPTNFMVKKNTVPHPYYDYFPNSRNLYMMEIAFHEYLGMLWAVAGGN